MLDKEKIDKAGPDFAKGPRQDSSLLWDIIHSLGKGEIGTFMIYYFPALSENFLYV